MNRLRMTGTVAAVAGSAVSLFLLINAGKSTPMLLFIMFVGWVALPFALLTLGNNLKRFSEPVPKALPIASIIITIASVSIYTYFTLNPLKTSPARTWLITPGIALIIIFAVIMWVGMRKA